jgi:hypothetical protein
MRSNQTSPCYFDNSLDLRPSDEVFGICPLPQGDAMALLHQPNLSPPLQLAVGNIEQTAVLPILHHSTRQIPQYEFLAVKQHSRFAVLPVHTQSERALFTTILRDNFLEDSHPTGMNLLCFGHFMLMESPSLQNSRKPQVLF